MKSAERRHRSPAETEASPGPTSVVSSSPRLLDSSTPRLLDSDLALHHVGIVVADLDAAVARYAALGFGGGERFEMPEQHVIVVTFRAGPGYVELIQPTDPEGPIARFMAKRGEGMHHVAYQVPNFAGALDRLAAAGVRLDRRGAPDRGARLAHRLHPPRVVHRRADRAGRSAG